jgi:hypothetical protein
VHSRSTVDDHHPLDRGGWDEWDGTTPVEHSKRTIEGVTLPFNFIVWSPTAGWRHPFSRQRRYYLRQFGTARFDLRLGIGC